MLLDWLFGLLVSEYVAVVAGIDELFDLRIHFVKDEMVPTVGVLNHPEVDARLCV